MVKLPHKLSMQKVLTGGLLAVGLLRRLTTAHVKSYILWPLLR